MTPHIQAKLAKRFEMLKKYPTSFGTVLGMHTTAEVRDLIALNDWRIKAVDAAVGRILARGVPTAVEKPLLDDWAIFMVRWNAAKKNYEHEASKIGTFDDMPMEEEFQKILHAISTTYPRYGDKDLGGLQQRVERLESVDWTSAGPRPELKARDLDHDVYKELDKITKKVDAVTTTVTDPINITGTIVAALVAMVALHKIGLL